MKKNLLLGILLSLTSTFSFAKSHSLDAAAVLKSTAERLSSLKKLSYHYEREINNLKDNYFSKISASCFLDFGRHNTVSPFIFQFKSDNYQQIFNGTEYFALSHTDKTIEINERPNDAFFSNFSYFYNSIPTMRSTLANVASTDTIPKSLSDTVVDGTKYHLVGIALKNKAFNYLSYRNFTVALTIYYKLLIDQTTYMPYQIIESNSASGDKYQTKTTFTNINTQPVSPEEKSWFYTTFQREYSPKEPSKIKPIVKTGTHLPDWTLPIFDQLAAKNLVSTNLKGKVVMLDFWIKNCSYCMASFPTLKSIQEKYGKRDFQLLAVNAYDEAKDLDFFYQRERPKYLMLYNGKKLADQLGIYSYPTVIIIGKDGKLAYVGPFDKEKLDGVIEENLNFHGKM